VREHQSRIAPRPLILAVIAGLTVLFLIALALNLSPSLRGPDEWRWAYAIPSEPVRQVIPALTLVAYVVAIVLWGGRIAGTENPSRRSICGFLIIVWLAVPVIQASLLSTESPDILRPLFYRTVSAGASGVFSVGSTIGDAGNFLQRYPELMPTFPVHPQRYPPGLPLLFFLARRPLEALPGLSDAIGFHLRLYQCHDLNLMRLPNATIATAALQMALPLLSGLIVFPLYGLARRIGGPRSAILAAALYPLVPSFAMWSGRWDQFYPVLTVTAWYLFHIGLTESRRFVLLAAGLVLSCASLLSFGLLAVLLPMGVWTLFWLLAQRKDRHWGQLLVDGLVFGAGLVSLWVLYQLFFGTGFADIWWVSMSYHLGLARGYWTWVGYHLYDFFSFLGLPLAFLFLVALVLAARRIPTWRERRLHAFPLAVGFGLLLLDLSGTARGEVARVWLFLTPFATLVAACGLAWLYRRRHLALIAFLLAAQLLVYNAYLRVVTTGITDPPTRERLFAPPPIAHPLQAQAGDQIRLLGYDVAPASIHPGETLHLTLYWQALQPMRHPYHVFTHLLGPNDQLAGQQDNMPVGGTAPTTCWVPGQVLVDPYEIRIDPEAAPGDYTLETGFYLPETDERLPTSGLASAPGGRIILTTISITEH
jgi:hypothetical protein